MFSGLFVGSLITSFYFYDWISSRCASTGWCSWAPWPRRGSWTPPGSGWRPSRSSWCCRCFQKTCYSPMRQKTTMMMRISLDPSGAACAGWTGRWCSCRCKPPPGAIRRCRQPDLAQSLSWDLEEKKKKRTFQMYFVGSVQFMSKSIHVRSLTFSLSFEGKERPRQSLIGFKESTGKYFIFRFSPILWNPQGWPDVHKHNNQIVLSSFAFAQFRSSRLSPRWQVIGRLFQRILLGKALS